MARFKYARLIGEAMIKAVIFDSGGVLTTDTDGKLYKNIARKFNISVKLVYSTINFLAHLFQTGRISHEEFWKRFSMITKRKLHPGYPSFLITDYIHELKKDPKVIGFALILKKN